MKKFIETLKNIWKIEDLRQRLLITILFVAIYRFGSFVVLPGINPVMLDKLQEQTSGGLLALLYVLRWCILQCVNFRTWNHALHLGFYRNAAPRCGCALFPEDAARRREWS